MCYSGTKIYFDPAEISKTLNEMPKFQDTPSACIYDTLIDISAPVCFASLSILVQWTHTPFTMEFLYNENTGLLL
jgi:hypothetical protein